MKINHSVNRAVLTLCVGMTSFAVLAQTIKVTLSGAQEVPPVMTSASGVGLITVAPDGALSGTITTSGVEGTMAHIHEAPMGQNGPVIVPFTKTSDNVWTAAAGAKLTEAQLQSFKSGNLYLNVHSATHKPGEIRAQLKP